MNNSLRNPCSMCREQFPLWAPISQVNHELKVQKTNSLVLINYGLEACTICFHLPAWPTPSKQILLPSWFLHLFLAFITTWVWTTDVVECVHPAVGPESLGTLCCVLAMCTVASAVVASSPTLSEQSRPLTSWLFHIYFFNLMAVFCVV